MFNKLKHKLQTYLSSGQSLAQLALAFCIGNYIAFSPFIGLHGLLAIAISWASGLSFPIMFAAAYGINNLLTAVPIYLSGYAVGYWIIHSVFHLDLDFLNPWWLEQFKQICHTKVGIEMPCIWSFLIGGNLLGIVTSIALYPIIKHCFKKIQNSGHPERGLSEILSSAKNESKAELKGENNNSK